MPIDFITKRPHKKSRAGCKTCKTKKIKCDEVHPRCGFCEKRDLTCEFIQKSTKSTTQSLVTSPETPNTASSSSSLSLPTTDTASGDKTVNFSEQPASSNLNSALTRNPTPIVPTRSGFLSQLDLRAMHFWSLFTSQTVVPGTYAGETLQVTIPQLAFDNEYLLDVMLGISSLHMQSLLPDPAKEVDKQRTAIYRAKAFSGYREALSTIDVNNDSNWEAALITSIMLTVFCARDYEVEDGDLIILHWLTLYRGLSSVIMMRTFPAVISSRVSPIFRRSLSELKLDPIVPYSLYQMLEDVQPWDTDYPHLSHLRKILDLLGVLYASLVQDGISVAFCTRVVSWCSLTGAEFTALAREKRPRALILLAHYLVFVKIMSKSVWWAVGVADGDIRRLLRILPPKWFPLLSVPKQALELERDEELMHLMLSTIDQNSHTAVQTSIRCYPEVVKYYAPKDQKDAELVLDHEKNVTSKVLLCDEEDLPEK